MNMGPKDGPSSLSSFQTESENNVAKDGTIISTLISIKPNGHLNNNGCFTFSFSYTEANGLKWQAILLFELTTQLRIIGTQ